MLPEAADSDAIPDCPSAKRREDCPSGKKRTGPARGRNQPRSRPPESSVGKQRRRRKSVVLQARHLILRQQSDATNAAGSAVQFQRAERKVSNASISLPKVLRRRILRPDRPSQRQHRPTARKRDRRAHIPKKKHQGAQSFGKKFPWFDSLIYVGQDTEGNGKFFQKQKPVQVFRFFNTSPFSLAQ